MKTTELPVGTVHTEMHADLAAALRDEEAALATWLDITPLARNEWLCFVAEGKLAETRVRRIERAVSQLAGGQRRPCCWPGCAHRERNGR